MMTNEEIKVALERTCEKISERPGVSQRIYSSVAVVEGGMACDIAERHHTISVDLPPSMGGEDLAPSPGALLRAALASCVAMGVKLWAVRSDIDIERIEVRVDACSDARGQFGVATDVAPGYESIKTFIKIESEAEPGLIREVVDRSLRFSPLMDALQRAQSVETCVDII